MKTHYDCIPCFVRQTLDAVRFVTSKEDVHESVLREVLSEVGRMDFKESPPLMGQRIHRVIRRLCQNSDPYKRVKVRHNQHALALYPSLRDRIENSVDRFESAVRMAIAGNIIDLGARAEVDDALIMDAIETALIQPLFGDIRGLKEAIDSAEKILYIGDNCGEIVFDRLLIETLAPQKITFVVRGNPVINDATMADAVATGMTGVVNVIDNGSDAPGTVLGESSEIFRQFFEDADMVIAKGQGNYETLSDADRRIYFLLKAKCAVIADHIGCSVGDLVIDSR